MAAAALTPRVRSMVVCDGAMASDIEDGVYTLEGVRQRLVASVFPCRRDLDVFLLLSYPRRGTYRGWIRVAQYPSDKAIRMQHFKARFTTENELLPLTVVLDNCAFPSAGPYLFEVWFEGRDADPVQKAEQPFVVRLAQE